MTDGAVEAITLTLQAFISPGDEVILLEPAFVCLRSIHPDDRRGARLRGDARRRRLQSRIPARSKPPLLPVPG